MQTVPSNVELAEITIESRIPVSTLRSTASPYKHNRTHSLFSLYLSQLTPGGLCNPLDFSKPSIVPSTQTFTFSCRPALTTRSTFSTSASNGVKEASECVDNLETRSEGGFWEESAFDTVSTRPSSPLEAHSSLSSAAADISSMFDSFQSNEDDEDDGATESDRPDSPAPPESAFHSSPFSSPLSTAPSSPATTLITIISPDGILSTTTTRPTAPCQPRDRLSDTKVSRQKRPRSPSPPPLTFTRPTRRSRASDPPKPFKTKTLLVDVNAIKKAPQGKLSPRSSKASKELIGPLVQVLALSGKSSMPTSSVVEEMLSSTPSLRSERTFEEWRDLAVITMSTSEVFGRAERKGLKNADNEMVEDEWYYRPENDDDAMRRGTLGTFQRGGGKRRATLQKKQYYWKPVK